MKLTKVTLIVVIIISIWAFSYKMGWNAAIKSAQLVSVTETGYTIEYTPSNIHLYLFE